MASSNETILEEANRIIYGDREKTYGHPAKNFENTARLWNAWVAMKHPRLVHPGFDVEDVAMMMALLKVARQAHEHKRDNLVDACGYLACIQKVLDYGEKTRNVIPSERGAPSAADPLPPENFKPLGVRTGRQLVQRGDEGLMGGVQVPDTAQAVSDPRFAWPHLDPTTLVGRKV